MYNHNYDATDNDDATNIGSGPFVPRRRKTSGGGAGGVETLKVSFV